MFSSVLRAFMALALLLFSACDPVVSTPLSCTEDFDCPATDVCGADQFCSMAPLGGDRIFAESTLSIGGADETHLLVVYDVPNADAVANEVAGFALQGVGGAPIGPSAIVRRVERRTLPIATPAQRSRFAFERARRIRTNLLISDLRAGKRSTRGALTRDVSVCSPACTDNEMCWKGSCIGGEASDNIDVIFADDGSTITCGLAGVVGGNTKLNVLVDRNASGSEEALQAAEKFASTFERELDILNTRHAGSIDRNGDGRLNIVFTDHESTAIGGSVIGFFDLRDFLEAATPSASGNESDILWVRLPTTTSDVMRTAGTLAHEYMHLASYAQRVHARDGEALREVLWLDEGMAHLMEDLTGWGPSNISAVAKALLEWDQSGFAISDSAMSADQELVLRGQAYLFLRHIVDQAGAGDASSSGTRAAAGNLISSLIAEEAQGFEHAAFRDAPRDTMQNWLTAVYTSGADDLLSAVHTNDYLPVATDAITSNLIGINPRAEFYSSSIDDIEVLEGPLVEELGSTDIEVSLFEGDVYRSGAVFYELTGLAAGEYVIRGMAGAGLDLRMFGLRVR